ncbi:MAG TPA: hypothetical protein VEA63_04955, partial [Opitutus sp.]|nr:hypothetical protein [Opitutus sp.]
MLCFASTSPAAALENDQVIVPKAAAEKSDVSTRPASGSGTLTLVAVLVLACAGGWMLWRGRNGSIANFRPGARAPRNLAVEETRSLGNRQYL